MDEVLRVFTKYSFLNGFLLKFAEAKNKQASSETVIFQC